MAQKSLITTLPRKEFHSSFAPAGAGRKSAELLAAAGEILVRLLSEAGGGYPEHWQCTRRPALQQPSDDGSTDVARVQHRLSLAPAANRLLRPAQSWRREVPFEGRVVAKPNTTPASARAISFPFSVTPRSRECLPETVASTVALALIAFASVLAAAPRSIVIRNVTVISMASAEPLRPANVLIRDGRIITLNANSAERRSASLRLNGTGKYLIPGLTDAHVHLPASRLLAEAVFDLLLANGVTTVFDMAGSPALLGLRENIRRGQTRGPRVFVSGPPLGDPHGRATVTSPEEVERAVLAQTRQGYDFVKLRGDLSFSAYRRLNAAARQQAEHFSDEAGAFTLQAGRAPGLAQILAGKACADRVDRGRQRTQRGDVVVIVHARKPGRKDRPRRGKNIAEQLCRVPGAMHAELEAADARKESSNAHMYARTVCPNDIGHPINRLPRDHAAAL